MIFFAARVLLRKNDVPGASAVIKRIYARATPAQIHLKTLALQHAVQESVDIANSTTLPQKLVMIVSVPVNRRALSEFEF